jgi:hypothetical protein
MIIAQGVLVDKLIGPIRVEGCFTRALKPASQFSLVAVWAIAQLGVVELGTHQFREPEQPRGTRRHRASVRHVQILRRRIEVVEALRPEQLG